MLLTIFKNRCLTKMINRRNVLKRRLRRGKNNGSGLMLSRCVETLRCVEHVGRPNGIVNVEWVAAGVVERLVEADDRVVVRLATGRHRAARAERADQLLKRRRHDAGVRRRRQRQRDVVHLVRWKLRQLVESLPRRRRRCRRRWWRRLVLMM